MKIAVMQPYVFPYLGYYQLVNAVDTFVIFDDVNYIKKGWINKNNVLVNGEASRFTIPVKDASQNKLINEVELSGYSEWKEKFMRTIVMSYKKAPQFGPVQELLTRVLDRPYRLIAELAEASIKETAAFIGMSTKFERSSEIKYNTKAENGQDKILEICRMQGAGTYINPINGKELYDRAAFSDNGIEIFFIRMGNIQYPQYVSSSFVPFLSMIDILMFNDKEQVKAMLGQYTLE